VTPDDLDVGGARGQRYPATLRTCKNLAYSSVVEGKRKNSRYLGVRVLKSRVSPNFEIPKLEGYSRGSRGQLKRPLRLAFPFTPTSCG
jgi:hypothetical protein